VTQHTASKFRPIDKDMERQLEAPDLNATPDSCQLALAHSSAQPSNMKDIFETTKADGNFTQMEYAEGLFFKKGFDPTTIRVQAPSIARVFTDGAALGSGSSSKTRPFRTLILLCCSFIAQIWMDFCSSAISPTLGR